MLYQGIFSYLPNITGCRYSMADIWHGKCQVITKVGVLTDGHRASAAAGQVVVWGQGAEPLGGADMSGEEVHQRHCSFVEVSQEDIEHFHGILLSARYHTCI